MAKEIEKVRQEYEEKQRRKKDREKQSAKDDSKDKDKNKEDKDSSDSKANDEKERDEKVCIESLPFRAHADWLLVGRLIQLKRPGQSRRVKTRLEFSHYTSMLSVPRKTLFSLLMMARTFYQMRIDRLRGIEMAKRNQERMRNPALFPSVPNREL